MAKIPVVTYREIKTQKTIDKHLAAFERACSRRLGAAARPRSRSPSPRGLRLPAGAVANPFTAAMLGGVKLRKTEGPSAARRIPAGARDLGLGLSAADIQGQLAAMKRGSGRSYVMKPRQLSHAEQMRMQTMREVEEKNRARAERARLAVVREDGAGRRKKTKSRSRKGKSKPRSAKGKSKPRSVKGRKGKSALSRARGSERRKITMRSRNRGRAIYNRGM